MSHTFKTPFDRLDNGEEHEQSAQSDAGEALDPLWIPRDKLGFFPWHIRRVSRLPFETFLVGGSDVEEHEYNPANLYPYMVDEGVIMLVPDGVQEPVALSPETRQPPAEDEPEEEVNETQRYFPPNVFVIKRRTT